MENKAYDIPEAVGDITPERAQQELNKLDAEWGGDSSHPIANKTHPQHNEFQVRREGLYERISEAPKPPELKMEELPGQVSRVKKAQGLMARLTSEHDYEAAEIKPDINAAEVRALQQSVYAAEGNFGVLADEFEIDTRDLRRPADLMEKLSAFSNGPSEDTANVLIRAIIESKRLKGFVL